MGIFCDLRRWKNEAGYNWVQLGQPLMGSLVQQQPAGPMTWRLLWTNVFGLSENWGTPNNGWFTMEDPIPSALRHV